jgi:metal-responsive CopG/Arc/MetJ family transcriptional regulator
MEVKIMEKVMITMPSKLLKDIDLAKEQLNQNRSQFIRYVISEYLKQQKKKEFEELMAKGYMESSEEDSIIVEESMKAQIIATEKEWVWDE